MVFSKSVDKGKIKRRLKVMYCYKIRWCLSRPTPSDALNFRGSITLPNLGLGRRHFLERAIKGANLYRNDTWI